MNNNALILLELLVVLVIPLLILNLRGAWTLRATLPCLLSLPILWYLTYAPIHELSHIGGAYLVGGTVTDLRLLPPFWEGEVGRAWITADGLQHPWQQLIMTSFPYVIDDAFLLVGAIFLLHRPPTHPFAIGLIFMLLCLRGAFDFMCETIAFVLGTQGDLYHIKLLVGGPVTWTFLAASIGLAIFSIVRVLKRFRGLPAAATASAH